MGARIDLEYDGAAFAGWALQPGLRTVQGELERALATVRGRRVPVTVGGRTDRGVHAAAQVASHDGAPLAVRTLNALLPADVRVLASAETADAFDARRDARGRTYAFRLRTSREASAFDRGHVLHWRHPVDDTLLRSCAEAVVGRNDFTAFTPTETAHVRFGRHVRRAAWHRDGDALTFWIEADAFMRHMNRILVGTMLEVAGGRRDLRGFTRLLGGAPRSAAGRTLPAHGLHLASIDYAAVVGGPSRSAHPWARPPWQDAALA